MAVQNREKRWMCFWRWQSNYPYFPHSLTTTRPENDLPRSSVSRVGTTPTQRSSTSAAEPSMKSKRKSAVLAATPSPITSLTLPPPPPPFRPLPKLSNLSEPPPLRLNLPSREKNRSTLNHRRNWNPCSIGIPWFLESRNLSFDRGRRTWKSVRTECLTSSTARRSSSGSVIRRLRKRIRLNCASRRSRRSVRPPCRGRGPGGTRCRRARRRWRISTCSLRRCLMRRELNRSVWPFRFGIRGSRCWENRWLRMRSIAWLRGRRNLRANYILVFSFINYCCSFFLIL